MGSAAGVVKTAARRIGVDVDEYERRIAADERWCHACREWHPRSAFSLDRSRSDGLARACRDSRNRIYRERYEPVPAEHRKQSGPPPAPARDGDVRQARHRVNVLVRTGRIPRPSDLPCVDCGHVWEPGDRRHEYDHHLGYDASQHLAVEAVCSRCHHARERQRAA